MDSPFLSQPPRVRLVKAFSRPVRNAVATARTCYSSRGILGDEDVGERDKYIGLARSVFEAGHHTVFQHAHFQFALENVSRQFLWSFLHAHPFYNSEQVSQRYVAVKRDSLTIPRLSPRAQSIFESCLQRQFDDYRALCEMMIPVVEAAYHQRFPRSEPHRERDQKAIAKRAQEVARYVLPVATQAYLYHTISGLTLLRYVRLARQLDAPTETEWIVRRMLDEVVALDPDFAELAQHPLDPSEMPEWDWLRRDDLFAGQRRDENEREALRFAEEFDKDFLRLGPRRKRVPDAGSLRARVHKMRGATTEPDLFPSELHDAFRAALEGSRAPAAANAEGFGASRLVAWHEKGERTLAHAVRQVLCLTSPSLSDDDAISLALDPAKNRLLGEALNLTTLSKISRSLHHLHYTFLKRLSHTADSQEQRHRMCPASRPFLTAHLTAKPDYVTPLLVAGDGGIAAFYRDSMARTWDAVARLRREGVDDEWIAYVLPNAVKVRYTESADLLHLRHKLEMRLCYNSQEEIWRASVEEAMQIAEVHPRIGRLLLPPCTLRQRAGRKPYCPEGSRYCGVRVWTLGIEEYERGI